MCSIATKEPIRKRRSSRLSQSEDVPTNGTETGSVVEEQTEDEDDLASNMTPRKRTRSNSLRKSARKTKTNGITSLANGTILEESDENSLLEMNSDRKLKEIAQKKKAVLENGFTNIRPLVRKSTKTNGEKLEANDGDEEEEDEEVEEEEEKEMQTRIKNSNSKFSSTSVNLNNNNKLSNDILNDQHQLSTDSVIMPRTDCLTNLLIQSLQSADDAKLHQILNQNQDKVMENTLRNLTNDYVQPFFQTLNKLLLRNSTNPYYISWMRKLFQCKVTTIVNLPDIRNELVALSDTLDIRCDLLERCYKLKGRLDLMLSLAENETKVPEKQNIILYEESSDSEPEQALNQDDHLMRLMDSEDEELDEPLEGELDEEEEQDLEDALLED